jgi:protein-tyrosine phosphatase
MVSVGSDDFYVPGIDDFKGPAAAALPVCPPPPSVLRTGGSLEFFNLPVCEVSMVLDVRPRKAYLESHISGALSLPLDVFASTLKRGTSVEEAETKLEAYFFQSMKDSFFAFESKGLLCIYGDEGAADDGPREAGEDCLGLLCKLIDTKGVPDGNDANFLQPRDLLLLRSFARVASDFPFLISRNASGEPFDADSVLAHFLDPVFFPSLIADWGFYLGGDSHARDRRVINTLQITTVINCTVECRNHFEQSADGAAPLPKVQYLRLPLEDTEEEDIFGAFEACYHALIECKKKNGRVLVHCHAGRSRSVACVVYSLMRARKIGLASALGWVKYCRSIAAPNAGFMRQLKEAEESLSSGGGSKAGDGAGCTGERQL